MEGGKSCSGGRRQNGGGFLKLLELILGVGELVDELLEGLEVALAVVLLLLGAVLVQVEGGEAVDALGVAEVLVVVLVGRAVDLGDLDAGDTGELGGQLVPGGREPLAVAAPRRVELDESHACGKERKN